MLIKLFLLLLLACASVAQAAAEAGAALALRAADKTSSGTLAPVQGATRAGSRMITVGDYGIVLLSDDDGLNFRQAATVASASTLTSLSFADAKNGWAAGHWGVILHTADGGENWVVQRSDVTQDRPLFSVHFFDANEGVAVGLWSLVLHTTDGGKTWNTINLPAPPEGGKADRNLFRLFANAKGSLFVAAERGMVLRSDDRGKTWRYLSTGYKGSLWTGIALADGTLIVAGLRGTVYRSADDGQSWQWVDSGTKSAITDLVHTADRLIGVGLDGVQIESRDQGQNFSATVREDRLSMTALLINSKGLPVRFSSRGVVREARQ